MKTTSLSGGEITKIKLKAYILNLPKFTKKKLWRKKANLKLI